MVTILRDDIHDDLCGDRNNINMYIYLQGFYCSEKVESSSSHGSDLAKEWLSLTIYKVFF
jgi:hypothetical protein